MLATGAVIVLQRARAKTQRILRWPQTRARVEPGSLAFRPAGWLPGKPAAVYLAAAAFDYEVDGRQYHGRAVVPVGWTILASEADRVRGELVQHATVLYNPAQPAEAYLDLPDRFHRGSIGWVTVKLICAAIAALALGTALLAGAG